MLHFAFLGAICGCRVSLRVNALGNVALKGYRHVMTGGGLEWRSEDREKATVLSPGGRVDESTASEFKDQLVAAASTGVENLVIDLHGIAYMSSRGLRALTLAQRKGAETGTTILLARPNETMREILAISRYDMIFKVTDTVEDAVRE